MIFNKCSLIFKRPLKCVYLRCCSISGVQSWNEDLSKNVKHNIEEHWKNKIYNEKFYDNDTTKEKYYVLSMFPYPSGNLHMGHVRVYTICDTVARYQRMNGKNVIHPIGWDSFGLPAENAAIERQIAPDVWTNNNIIHMRDQFRKLGCSFEWEREFASSDPSYYRWTQDLFLKLYEAGMVYQKEAYVNWDPVDQTVLADEQVDENGCSWRSGAKVTKRLLKQWFVRTTRFAKQLYDNLDDSVLQDWRDVLKIQKHWIGECNGVNFEFGLSRKDGENKDFIQLWTSTPEYIRHAKFVAITKSHILSKEIGNLESVTTEKLGIEAVNPFTGEKIPIFITDEVEFLPFTDCYLGIPGVSNEASRFALDHEINFSDVNLLTNEDQIKEEQARICEDAKKLNAGGYWTSAKLKDWLISRQRYWGTPIPMIHCSDCGPQPVPRTDLPVQLPKIFDSTVRGGSVLSSSEDWVNAPCPKCRKPAKRETDTMDTFVDSSWYYVRFLDHRNTNEMFDVNKIWNKMPVDLYIGGKEHAVLHLYYARFMCHFMHSLNLVPEKEPFKRLLVQGMVMGRSFRIKGSGQYVQQNEVKIIDAKKKKAVLEKNDEPVVMTWEKMSKSKQNGVDPTDMFNEYGVDTTRLLILADVAPTSHRNWNSDTFPGILNWQKRLWLTMQSFLKYRNNTPERIPDDIFNEQEDYMFDSRNYYIKGTSFNYVIAQQLSVAISKQQGLTNSIRKAKPYVMAKGLQYERALATQIILLAPMAPHFASELWSGFLSAPNRLNHSGEIDWKKSVLEQRWPETDRHYKLDLECQVNGVTNCFFKLARSDLAKLTKGQALAIAMNQPQIQDYLKDRRVDEAIFTYHDGLKGIINVLARLDSSKIKVEN